MGRWRKQLLQTEAGTVGPGKTRVRPIWKQAGVAASDVLTTAGDFPLCISLRIPELEGRITDTAVWSVRLQASHGVAGHVSVGESMQNQGDEYHLKGENYAAVPHLPSAALTGLTSD